MNRKPLSELDAEITSIKTEHGISVGVHFICPSCAESKPHAHSVIATWSGPSIFPSGAVWRLESAPDVAVLTISPSIDCSRSGTCRFHGWVRNGFVEW